MPPYSEKRLKNYALWYYERYLPSIQKLRLKLLEKSNQNFPLAEKIITEIKDIFIEELLIDQQVRFLIDRHKNKKEILQKLKQKLFDMNLVTTKIEEYAELLSDWNIHDNHINKEIIRLLDKGKSLDFIQKKLFLQFPLFKPEIQSLIHSGAFEDTENLRKDFEKIAQKHTLNTYEGKQKILAKLLSKGYSMRHCKDFLENVVK